MGDLVRVGSLEIDQDLRYQRLEWRIERVGWMLGGLLLLAALAGLFGSGPLSWASAGGGTPLQVSYERFLRYGAPNRLTVLAESGPGGVLHIDVSSAYLSRMRVNQVFPEPSRVASSPAWTRFEFEAAPRGRSEIVLDLEPARRGRAEATLRLDGQAPVHVRQFVYP